MLTELHPLTQLFDESLRLRHDACGGAPQRVDEGVGDYVADSGEGLAPGTFEAGGEPFHNPHPASEFAWGVGEVASAVLGAGMVVEALREYPYMNGWRAFPGLRDLPGRRMALAAGSPRLPLTFGLAARRP